MEPFLLATATASALTPYIAASEEISGGVARQSVLRGEAILKAFWSRWHGKPSAETSLATFVVNPTKGRRVILRVIADDLAGDHDFAEALYQLLKGGRPEAFLRAAGETGGQTGAEIRDALRARLLTHADATGVEMVAQQGREPNHLAA